jgi:hypothetical protein
MFSAYSHWANCGLGSTVTTEDVKEIAPGIRMISATSMTLAAVEKDKVVVDMVVRNRVEGGDFAPTETLQEVEIPAAEEEDAPHPHQVVAEGEETLEIAGRKLLCRWRRVGTREDGGIRTEATTWTCDQIPGGLARSEFRVDGDPPQSWSTEVVAFDKKPRA